ncbi:MAG TPA: EAL domain-containing protein [Steroidobacteraceae bacterium]|nr:EAL domain-containing protein [Steroidobacteraceae bacterium]
MTRTPTPETKTRIRQSPLPVIGAVVAVILVAFYGWSQRAWLVNVSDIESRDVDMQSQQLERGFESELDDLYQAMSDYAIWNETAEFARGNRPEYFKQSLNAAALVRLDVDTFLVLDRNLETRASLALDATSVQEYEIPPDPELLAVIRQAVTSGQLNGGTDQVSGIVQRARGPGLFAVRPIFDNTGAGQPQGWIAFARAFTPSVVVRIGRFSPWPVNGFPVTNLDRAGLPDEVREWVRTSPITSNKLTRVAGRSHVNGYLILRDQLGTPIWLVQLEIPRSASAQATRTTLYQTILLGLLVVGFTIVAVLLVARSRRLNADRLALESRYRAIIEQAQDGLLIADARTGEIVDANPAVQQQLGFTLDELRGRSILSVLRGPNDSQDPVIATLARVEPSRGIELVQWLKDGRQMDVEVSCVPIESRDRRLVSYLMRDLSERKKAQTQLLANQQRLDKLANHDTLTGLPNRLFLQAHLPEALARSQESGHMLAVLFLDLDRFKHINDSRGHEVGDKLLQEIAKRVRAAVRPADIVVRMGGDEFVVVLHKVHAPDEVAVAATRINEVLSAPVMVDGRALVVTVSIGVSLYPRDGATMGELLKHSDTAMYQAKDLGRNNFQVFSPQMDRTLKERVAIESSLRAGLKLNQFDVHYQPIIDIHTRRVAGLEALLRWRHPTQGYVSPERFIEVAEETGLIIPIGQFVLDRIGRDISQWREQGAHLVPVSMNVSAVQLERTKLRELIQQAMQRHRIGPQLIALELTEGSLFETRTGEFREDALATLRDLGVKIAIDDFGTGYSSLSYLKRWRVDSLKIDRSFVRDIATDPSDHAIVSAIVAMARSLNIQVVAEGIETWQQLEILRNMGCTYAQGFLFAKPCGPGDALRYLKVEPLDLLEAHEWASANTLAETG